MNDRRDHRWPGQEPEARWPGEDPDPRRRPPSWPGAEPGYGQRRPPQQPSQPQWPGPGRPAQANGYVPPGRARRDTADQPTGFVPPVPDPNEPDPGLLTHDHLAAARAARQVPRDRYDDQQRFNDFAGPEDEPEDEESADPKAKPPLTPAQRKKRRWRRIRRTLYALFGLFVVLPAIAFTITYFMVDVPTPEEVAAKQSQVVTYLFADGSEMGKEVPQDGGGNRVILKPQDIPDQVKHAVYAAEDATFETNSGFDLMGIARAGWAQVTGGEGGGSTISQQYIKKATENEEATITRKWTEIVKAFKMNNEQSKEDIITAYLNTIYFGRGANGIQTAAQAYFKKDAKALTAPEAALLAGLIQGPSNGDKLDKQANIAYATERWNYVMDQMVSNGWMSPQERASARFPTPIPLEQAKPKTITGPNAHIQQRVKDELAAKGFPEEKLFASGYKIQTSIDPRAQKIATDTVNEVMQGQPEKLKEALVAIDPKTGGVKAYYGGPASQEDAVDWANTPRNPGSSYKPFDLVALLQKGKGLGEVYDGSSPRTFQGIPVANSPGVVCGKDCSVAEAMEKSVNTVFYDMVVNDTGVPAVVEAARAAGIPEAHGDKPTMANADNNISIGGGTVEVTAEDMAAAYATFAAEGMRRQQHFVEKVTTPGGETAYEASDPGTPAFDSDPQKSKDIAGNVTKSLVPVVSYSHLDCSGGRPCAGKTGTHEYVDTSGKKTTENSQAWMVGYTPSLSTSVWVGTGKNDIIKMANGRSIYGKDLPGKMWQKFMDGYLRGTPIEKFGQFKTIGRAEKPPQTTTQQKPSSSSKPPSSESEKPPPSSSDKPPSSSRPSTGRPSTGLPTGPPRPGDEFGGNTTPNGVLTPRDP